MADFTKRRSSIDVEVSLSMGKKPAEGERTDWAKLDNVSDIPDLGGTRENIEVTAIGDSKRRYIAGIAEDASELEFTCFYEAAEFEKVKAGGEGAIKVEIKEDGKAVETFIAEGHISAALAGFGVGDALTYTLKVNVTEVK